jgi:UDP-N-acetylmuramate--alanine ligase
MHRASRSTGTLNRLACDARQSSPSATIDRAPIRGSQHWSSPFAAKRIHLIGVGGCGMSGLAGVLLRCGAYVSGSDIAPFESQRRLEELGATLRIGHAPINLPRACDLVVHSAAIRSDNSELIEATRRGIPRLKYSEMLGQVMALRTGVAIAGTHGKSTTTALLAFILRQARSDPTFVVGANVPQLEGSCGVGDGPFFVVEACEFDRSFLNLHPHYAAILNIEEDHLDCFADIGEIIAAFRDLAGRVPADGRVLANGEDRHVATALRLEDHAGGRLACPVETFGFASDHTWQAANLTHRLGCYEFDVYHQRLFHLRAALTELPGRHNVLNALAAIALAHHAGVAPAAVQDALSRFAGADRRMTRRAEAGGILFLDDYGHHPTEIQATLEAVREHYPERKLWLIFQPHQHSRTRFLLEDFAKSFGLADHLLVPDIYFVRDSDAERNAICSGRLVERIRAAGGDALYLPSHGQIVEHVVKHARQGDIVLTMGAGDVWKISDELVRRLS